ncbi:hypothetical protein, partial [Acinetobacter baumannii]
DKAAEAAQLARNAWKQIVRNVGQESVAFTAPPNMLESLGARVATLPGEIRLFQEDLATRQQWLKASVLR